MELGGGVGLEVTGLGREAMRQAEQPQMRVVRPAIGAQAQAEANKLIALSLDPFSQRAEFFHVLLRGRQIAANKADRVVDFVRHAGRPIAPTTPVFAPGSA